MAIFESGDQRRESWRYTPSTAERSFGLWPLNAGRTQTRSSYHVGPRVIEHHNIHVVLEGAIHLRAQLAGDAVKLLRGDAFVLFPGLLHEYWADQAEPPRMTWVGFDGPGAHAVTRSLPATPGLPYFHGLDARAFTLYADQLDRVFAAADSWQPLAHVIGFLATVRDGVMRSTARNRTSWLEQGRELLDAHCTDGITVHEVAQQIGIDRSHFSKAFAQQFDTSPAEYLRQARLGRAHKLLQNTSLSVTEIALSAGYADLYSFSHAFRKRYGQAPSAARGHSQ